MAFLNRFFLLIAMAPLPAGAEVMGVQAVSLHCWEAASARELAKTVKLRPPSAFAISSAPFLAPSRGCKDTANGITDRLNNLETVLTELRSETSFPIHVISYLAGLHDTGVKGSALHDLSGSPAANFAMFWDRIIAKKEWFADQRMIFLVGASLEDNYPNSDAEAPNDALTGLLAGIARRRGETDDGPALARITMLLMLVRANRFYLVHGPVPDNTLAKPEFDRVIFSYSRISLTIPVLHESHGPKPGKIYQAKLKTYRNISGYGIWSNDGPLVAFDCRGYGLEGQAAKAESCKKCEDFGPAQSLSTFRSASPSPSGYRLLWRPMYNAFTRNGESYVYPGDGSNRPIANLAFGEGGREREALLRFLSGTCPL